MGNKQAWARRRERVASVIEIGSAGDWLSRGYDMLSTLVLLVNLTATVLTTFESAAAGYGAALNAIEGVTVGFFAADYLLRLWTADCLCPGSSRTKSLLRYVTSFTGIVDLLSFLPHYLPFFFPAGAAAFRIFRVIRIFRMFQINAYYDALAVIGQVISSKKQQLLSSVFILLVLMLASSLCMYSLEHEAQPEVFANAFSGIWWSVSTLLTVGYGDIYPITTLGKAIGIVITFLGVGMVAIPTGIISAGFVEQYTRLQRIGDYAREDDLLFIKARLRRKDGWTGRAIMELGLPGGVVVAMVRRGDDLIIPKGDTVLQEDDIIILGSEPLQDDAHVELKEVVLRQRHPWNGLRIKELDMSRQTMIVMVKRQGTMLIPRGDLVLMEGDHVILYSQAHIPQATRIRL